MPQSSSQFSSNPSLPMGHLAVSAPLRNIPAFDNQGGAPTRASLNRLQQLIGVLDSTLRLPNTPRAFGIYLLGLVIVSIGAFLHVLVAAQIMQAEFQLARLQEEYRAIEQQNGDLIFQLARDANMARLHAEITKAGYGPVQEREYIIMPPTEAPADVPADTIAATDATDTVASGTAQATLAAAPASTELVTHDNSRGQWARWEDFWRSSLGMSARTQTATARPAQANVIGSSVAASTSGAATTNFWAVWWEQASEQGEKLLQQWRSQ